MIYIEPRDAIFQGAVRFEIHPVVYVDLLYPGLAVQNVKNQTVFKSPTAATTVTNFTGGVNGQTIRILGNGNLTVSNGTYIKTNTGADKVLAANKMYVFTLIENRDAAGVVTSVWYEDA